MHPGPISRGYDPCEDVPQKLHVPAQRLPMEAPRATSTSSGCHALHFNMPPKQDLQFVGVKARIRFVSD